MAAAMVDSMAEARGVVRAASSCSLNVRTSVSATFGSSCRNSFLSSVFEPAARDRRCTKGVEIVTDGEAGVRRALEIHPDGHRVVLKREASRNRNEVWVLEQFWPRRR
jgi:hypothetical protein